ncbi:SCO2322 family protein [Streptomyces sp. RFCAC02]|uniref:SCO2322 family protein n=1 Tax=Streptomyces sp. RFCAC02 TaxID=2499143 RepID=UPI00101FDEE1|nr:SCO2322 family protein [Streptomyces sp. RFCAC02]
MRAAAAVLRGLACVALAAVPVLGGGAGTARADGTAYRYWSFWQAGDGGWTYALEGPGSARPDAGDVIGFRFAVSEEASGQARPRTAPDFAALCGTDDAGGAARVGVVIDFGTADDAPDGEEPPAARSACADLPDGATAAEVLASVAEPLRYDGSALLCAIAGYPARGCGDAVGDTASGDEGSGAGSVWTVAAGAGVVALLGGAAVVRARRGRA